jgi:phenylpropionate dioxygenase-like ring-hydroxylating dioxygenase large terminal subunit
MGQKEKLITFGRRLDSADVVSADPDWVQARPSWIGSALRKALELPSGGWYVVGASRDVRDRPRRHRIDGQDFAVWRSHGAAIVAPDECPHMGASLSDGYVRAGCVVCPWHGLELGPQAHGSWRPVKVFDDGVLLWARLGAEKSATPEPILPERPRRYLDAVVRMEAACEPLDVIANRLDPWHGVHYHPHSFARLKIVEQREDSITARVVYRVIGRLGIEVDARFHCPDPRTIAMTIVAGEGTGSIVETHATPIEPGRTAVIEATLATSDRPQFYAVVRTMGAVLRPLVRWRAHKLWVEDGAYAERRHAVRKRRGS